MLYTSAAIRSAFLTFFTQHQHYKLPSSSLVPAEQDTSLLFTNAGMVPFKQIFLGQEQPPSARATTAQRCVRAGGKHNDLENVGYTARHHTFFEMLGNFSFGDYFKREAIQYAWQFLTETLELPAEKLWITVYAADAEAAAIWLNKIGIAPDRLSRIGDKPGQSYVSDNFWSMGDTGPCGPCSEIFYDHGPSVPGGPPGTPEEDGDRYIEIWNLVFMQYNRDAHGEMTPLPKPSVDTGMGLERLAAVLQGVHSNYEIDLFQALIQAAAQATDTTDLQAKSLRVIADHIRSAAFLIVDGVVPDNEGRGYVLRRIIRRAVRHGHQLGQQQPFFYTLVTALDQQMGEAYPELRAAKQQVAQVLHTEEIRFAETLNQGMRILEEAISQLTGTQIAGDIVFKLYDTYGFPLDLTADIAREQGLSVDEAGFDQAMAAQKSRARSASRFAHTQPTLQLLDKTYFTGYTQLTEQATIIALYQEGLPVEYLPSGAAGVVILDKTPCYAEAGGQAGDQGEIYQDQACFKIEDTQPQGEATGHIGTQQTGRLSIGSQVQVKVHAEQRQQTALNHSATHLLHAALRQVLGKHVQQQGSSVDAQRLRFDFTHAEPVTAPELRQVERLVNTHIRYNHLVETRLMALEDAQASGALALFNEKYAAQVRVLRMGDFSTELCGGTHVHATGDIGLCKIVAENGVAAGVRRIEAITGERAMDWVEQSAACITDLSTQLQTAPQTLPHKLTSLLTDYKQLQKTNQQLQAKLAVTASADLAAQAVTMQGIAVLAVELPPTDKKALRTLLDQLKHKLGSAIILLATTHAEKIQLIAGVSQDLQADYPANQLIQLAAAKVGGKGGGRADMAQAGGSNPKAVADALAVVRPWVEQRIAELT